MKTSSPSFTTLAIAAAVTLLVAIPASAQNSPTDELTIQTADADHAAALAAKLRYRHELPSRNAAGRELRARQTTEGVSSRSGASGEPEGGEIQILQYFGDVSYGGGQVVKSAISHAIYLQPQSGDQCAIVTCWGDPEGFLRDLGRSDFIHVVDQYVGLSGNNRYTVGFNATVNYAPQATPLLDTDIQAIVHAVAAKMGASGYGHIYDVFLPPGQDECSDSTLSECYSPDNDATFFYSAYHSSVDFPDIGHVLYTVQPYQNVGGCQVQPGTINGRLIDAADTALGHETFETITDPDGDAWTNSSSAYYRGSEIADECLFYKGFLNEYFDSTNVPTFLIGAHLYSVQLIYSNEQQACSSAP
jgi:hypothetical protein